MPLEVREIGIRLSVGESAAEGGPAPLPGGSDGKRLDERERAALVEECVEAVLAALRLRSER